MNQNEFMSILKVLHNSLSRGQKEDWKYKSYEELVMKEGYYCNDVNVEQSALRKKEERQCYWNSFVLSCFYPNLIYCEGYAFKIIPTLHAWNFDIKSKKIVDSTWDYKKTNAYFGIAFNNTFVKDTIKQRNKCENLYELDFVDYLSIIIDNYKEEYSFLKYGIPDNAKYILSI